MDTSTPPKTYIPSTSPTPTYGTQSPAVLALQQSLNKANAGKPGWIPLKEDSMYGPKTFAATTWKPTTNNNLIVTGTKPAQDFAKNTQYINQAINQTGQTNPQITQPVLPDGSKIESPLAGMENYSDPYTKMLDKISATSDKATQNLIATIKAQKANQVRNINEETDRLKSGLMSLGLSTGNINFTPDLVYGSIAQAENARMSKLTELDRNEATALIEAQQASENKDFQLLKERIDYIKSIKKTRLDLLKDSYDTMAYEAKIGELQANQIYDELQKLPESSKLPFLQQIATKFNIPLAALTSQVGEITRDRAAKTKKSGGGTSGGKVTIASASAEIGQYLKPISEGGVLGEDGYMSPYKWLELRDTWLKNKLTKSTFDTLFKRYLNPLSYAKAGFTTPKAASGRKS